MSTVGEHYDKLLATHYSWMSGLSFEEKVAEQKAILMDSLSGLMTANGLAIDLGCGPGYQTVALLELGFRPVLAVDGSSELLAELRAELNARSGGTPVEVHEADLRALRDIAPAGGASVIVCMGDTLTHLPSREEVCVLLRDVFTTLAPGGVLVVTWRDLTGKLKGLDRFLPVRSDDSRIMTCFLEYEGAETVLVHDLIYTREPTGWNLNKSCYRKLRLGSGWLADALGEAGFRVERRDVPGRLQRVVAAKG